MGRSKLGNLLVTTRATNIERLVAATDWGLDDSRTAWVRSLALSGQEPDRYPSSELISAKSELRAQSRAYLESWYDSMFDEASATANTIDIKDQLEELWKDLVCMNEGVFAHGPDPLDGFVITIPSLRAGDTPLVLSPQLDGWGVASA